MRQRGIIDDKKKLTSKEWISMLRKKALDPNTIKVYNVLEDIESIAFSMLQAPVGYE